MKRFNKLSVCTLVLSLFIAFGFSQNSISYGKVLDTDSSTTKVEGNVTNTEFLKSLSSDDQTNAASITARATDAANKAGTPVINKNNLSAMNGKVLIYKNVNLSNCKSAKDVVKTLRKNGYTKINMKNVKNIKALKSILAEIKKGGSKVTTQATKVTPAPVAQTPAKTKPATTPAPATKPVSTTKPAPATAPVSSNASFAKEVLRLVNIERDKAGLSHLTTNSTLTAAADKRAQETKQSFSHTRPNGTGFQTALNEYGVAYRTAGENIAYGQKSPQEVVTGWMNSPGHRANILNANFNKIGIGVYQSNGVYYWSQLFTN